MFLDELPAGAIDAVVETGVSPLVTLEIRALGGAIATPSESHGAVGSLDAEFVMFAAGFAPTPELAAAVEEAVDRAKAALAPWESERSYFNFSERQIDGARLYPAETYRRLRMIKTASDPGEFRLQPSDPAPAVVPIMPCGRGDSGRVRPAGFEPATRGLEVRRSVH